VKFCASAWGVVWTISRASADVERLLGYDRSRWRVAKR
jgi:hypothetical protein